MGKQTWIQQYIEFGNYNLHAAHRRYTYTHVNRQAVYFCYVEIKIHRGK